VEAAGIFSITESGAARRLVIENNTGNVGIGTASPAGALEVSGTSAKIRSTWTGTSSAGVGGALQVVQDDGAAISSGDRIGYLVYGASEDASNTIHFAAALNAFATETWSSTKNGAKLDFEVTANGATSRSKAMTILQDGNVGIGTTSPGAKLEIKPSDGGNALLIDAGAGNNEVGYLNWSIGGTEQAAIRGYYQASPSANVLAFYVGNDNDEKMRIISSGNVGIGTTSPDELLDVEDGNIRLKSDNDGNTGVLRIYDSTPTESGQIYGASGDLKIWSGADVLFTQVGNVGIGTTSPQRKIDIVSPVDDFVTVGARTMNTGNWSGIHFGYREENNNYRKSAIIFERTGNAAEGKIHFLNDIAADNGNAVLTDSKMVISDDGNVGIGTTSP
ncbi:MAG: hypothetical protein QF535_09040, partial [Anaerolineales bacterium]|nr:hypothetical protein [Anaerolineales bacterium]